MAPAAQQLMNRFSLAHLLVALTIMALMLAIVRGLKIDLTLAYALLLAPTMVYTVLRGLAIAIKPFTWCSRRPGLILGLLVGITLIVVLVENRAALIVMLPLAAGWMPQIVLAVLVERWIASRMSEEVEYRLKVNDLDGTVAACFSLLLLLAVLAMTAAQTQFYVIGKGTVFGKYWMLIGSAGVTEYQWQSGYSGIPWTWKTGSGIASPATSDRDWSWLGFERYRTGRIEKMRIPYWSAMLLLLLWPIVWAAGWLRVAWSLSQRQILELESDVSETASSCNHVDR